MATSKKCYQKTRPKLITFINKFQLCENHKPLYDNVSYDYFIDFHNWCATILTEDKRKKPQPTTARL